MVADKLMFCYLFKLDAQKAIMTKMDDEAVFYFGFLFLVLATLFKLPLTKKKLKKKAIMTYRPTKAMLVENRET